MSKQRRSRHCAWERLGALAVLSGVALAGCTPNLSLRSRPSAAVDLQLSESYAAVELAARLGTGRGVERDPASGAALMERIAETGSPLAQTFIGLDYYSGTGVDRDPAKAANWLRRAASQNFPWAEAELAFLYVQGVGVPRDPARAVKLAKAAARRGAPEGEDALGVLYAHGWGVRADGGDAKRWLRKAADRGYWRAMLHLGEFYRDGKMGPVDNVLAYAWFDLAAAHAGLFGRAAAGKARDDTGVLLLPGDLAVARQLAASWRPGEDLAARRAAGVVPQPVADQRKPLPAVPLPGAPPVQRSDAPVVARLLTYQDDVRPDGSDVSIVHLELQARNDAAAQQIAQDPIRYTQSREQVQVLEAYTLKPDGRKLKVDPASIQTQLPPGARDVPMFDDRREKVILFPSVEAGDILVTTVKYVQRPIVPGLFSLNMPFERSFAYDKVRVTITAPAAMPLLTETHDMAFSKHSAGDKTVYQWDFANPNPPAEKIQALDDHDVAPRAIASSFHSYDQLAAAYARLAADKVVPGPAVRALAEKLTAGVSDRRKQTELLYAWVSRHIRYVAIELGQAGFVPHAAEAVLANGYGDCKDHAILFQSLLKAKGIASNTALINLGNAYSLPTPPTLAPLNHAITWVPEFHLYLDTTAAVAPFGVLPFEEYGKPVVIAEMTGAAVQRTPLLPPRATSLVLKTKARLMSDGRIEGESESTATGSFALMLRDNAVAVQSMGPEQAASSFLRSNNLVGSGRFDFASPYDPGPSYRISGSFSLSARPELLSGNSFYLPTGLDLGPRPGNFLMGDITFRDFQGNEPTPCFSGREEQELSLELPEGRTVRELPKPFDFDIKGAHYHSEWSQSGRTVTLRRVFSTALDQPLCVGSLRRQAAVMLGRVRFDYSKAIALAPH